MSLSSRPDKYNDFQLAETTFSFSDNEHRLLNRWKDDSSGELLREQKSDSLAYVISWKWCHVKGTNLKSVHIFTTICMAYYTLSFDAILGEKVKLLTSSGYIILKHNRLQISPETKT